MTPTQTYIFSNIAITSSGIVVPLEDRLMRNWPRGIPPPDDTDWQVVVHAARVQLNTVKVVKPLIQPPVAASLENSVHVSTGEVMALCRKLKLDIVPHPTNPGITSMRARNALKRYREHHAKNV